MRGLPDALTGGPHQCNARCGADQHCSLVYLSGDPQPPLEDVYRMAKERAEDRYGVQFVRMEAATEAPPGDRCTPVSGSDPAQWKDARAYLIYWQYRGEDPCAVTPS